MTIFESFLGLSTPQHGLILVVLYVRSKVHFIKKLLDYGKIVVILGLFQDICILKLVNFCPLMASTVPYHGYNFAKYFLFIFRVDMVFSLLNMYN